MSNEPVIVERTFAVPSETIWNALTDKTQMKDWYFDVPDFKPEVGCEFSFSAGPEGKEFMHLCKVTEVVPRKKIAYTWDYEGYPGNSEVSFELDNLGSSTHIKITHTGLETFGDNPDFAKANFVEGWTGFMDVELKKHLQIPE